MGLIKRIENITKEYDILRDELLKLIDYGSEDGSVIELRLDQKWSFYRDELYIYDGDDVDDYYGFTISSYSARGKKLYLYSNEDNTIIMAYPMDGDYYNTCIYIFENSNKKDHE